MGSFFNAETQRRRDRREDCRHASATSASLRLCVKIISAFALPAALFASKPETPKLRSMHAPPPRPAAQKRLIFGVGVGFEKNGAAQGAVISTVLPNSPATRAGLPVGGVITEINGQPTVGRAGDDCARMIRDAFGPVRLKFLDAALKEKTLTLDKAWLPLPE